MTYTICEPCIDVKDRACVDECPVDCIYEGGRMLYIHPDECVDCGACEPVCPVTAIFYEDDVPAEWKKFTPINAEWFGDAVTGRGGGPPEPGRHSTTRSATARFQTSSPLSVRMTVRVHPSFWPRPPKEMSACSAAKSGQSRHPGLVNAWAFFSEYVSS